MRNRTITLTEDQVQHILDKLGWNSNRLYAMSPITREICDILRTAPDA